MGKIKIYPIVLLFMLAIIMMQPVQASETTEIPDEIPEGWIVITYVAEEVRSVMIPRGTAIADLWEPETVWGSKFLYWTYGVDSWLAESERRRITKDTIFYESDTLRPVTEDTDKEAFQDESGIEYFELPDEPTTERDGYYVRFHWCLEKHDVVDTYEIRDDITLASTMDGLESEVDHFGYDFVGWYTEREGGTRVTPDTSVVVDMDVYAHWKKNSEYMVWYMKNYGTDEQFLGGYGFDGTIAENFPVSRKGYQFTGWYTKPKGGEKIKVGHKLTSELTLYAHWKKIKVKKVSIKRLFGKDKAIKVKYRKQSGVKGYQVQISTSKSFTKKKTITKTYNNNTVFTRTIKKLKKGKNYYLRIRAYKQDSAGKRVYGKWSKAKQVKTK